ncbi:MAG TPA: hypothetical protein VGN36_05115 [Sphingorhabdus sp.]|jgi:hypothetical protein|nr:hypothetical protein [Sphingorhabdus sp.]
MTKFPKRAIALLSVSGALMVGATATTLSAHPGPQSHAHQLDAPIAGERNNYWYDYRSDLEEAEIELRKDLRRAKTAQDRREAYNEYDRELIDARKDYMQEMRERGYLRRGTVEVLD